MEFCSEKNIRPPFLFNLKKNSYTLIKNVYILHVHVLYVHCTDKEFNEPVLKGPAHSKNSLSLGGN